ncbi:MAG: alpha-L-rhamnosidase-related protein, partial [Candidatus Latescibacterota bacterium]
MDRSHFVPFLLLTALFAGVASPAPAAAAETAQWIWSSAAEPAPKNRFTYFRKVVDLPAVPEDAALRFAADSNARLWINGHLVRRKVARYFEDKITAEVIDAAPFLHPGKNVVVSLHHNWGDIITFQRSANKHAGLYLEGSWVRTDASWKCITAPEFLAHDKQAVGVIGHARIRYPQVVDGGKRISGDLHDAAFDDSGWSAAIPVSGGPWPARPADVETPGQREHPVRPLSVLAAGSSVPGGTLRNDPLSMASDMKKAKLTPDAGLTMRASGLPAGKPVVIEGKAGTARYITFDFGLPVHGYPLLKLAEASTGVTVDFGYGEIPYSLRDGSAHVRPDGWINTEGVVGPGYGDRYITRSGAQEIELPDERTARWMAVHVRFPRDGRIVLEDIGMVHSQYPIRMAGSFSCGDERIEQIVKLCRIHAEVTMSDAYVDTPGREDGQWIEDDRPRANIGARWFGDNQLRRFLIRTYAESQGSDGGFHPFPPSNFPAYPASYDWSVQWVAVLYDDYLWTGETDLIEQHWDALAKYWTDVLSHTGADGVWRTSRVYADIRVGLHPENDNQSSGIVTPWIIERLRSSAEMAVAAGKKEQAARWRATSDTMADAFRKLHIVPARGAVPAHVGDRLDTANPALERGYSQAGQTVALLTGLLTPEEARANLEYAFTAPEGAPSPGVTRWNNPTYF